MKFCLMMLLAFSSIKIFAQQKSFSTGDNGRFIYYEVVEPATGRDSLMLRANAFIDFYKRSIKRINLTDTSITAKGMLLINKTILVANHPSGEVSYDFTFEARDKKYRFWLTGFEYIPYSRDRYGNYVAATNIGTALEKTPGKLSVGEWNAILESAYNESVKFSENFKKALAANLTGKKKQKTKTISINKW